MIALQKSSRIWTICRLFPHNHGPAAQSETVGSCLASASTSAAASLTNPPASAHGHVETTPPSRNVSQSAPRVMRALADPENMGKSQKGVNFDTLGSWNKRLDLPIMFEQSVQYGKPIPKIPLEEIGIASLMGRRKTNEDRYVVKELAPDLLMAGIFDGHGGPLAAEYLSEHLEDHILHWLRKSEDLEFVLEQAFTDINNMLGRHIAFYHLCEAWQGCLLDSGDGWHRLLTERPGDCEHCQWLRVSADCRGVPLGPGAAVWFPRQCHRHHHSLRRLGQIPADGDLRPAQLRPYAHWRQYLPQLVTATAASDSHCS